MKNTVIGTIFLILIVAIVGVAGYSLWSNDNANSILDSSSISLDENQENVISSENELVNVQKVDNLNDFKNVLAKNNENKVNSSEFVDPDVIKKVFENINDYKDDNVTVFVNGPYKYDNGTAYYQVILKGTYNYENNEIPFMDVYEVDANKKPTVVYGQNTEIDTAYNIYQVDVSNSDEDLQLSKEMINKARQIHQNDEFAQGTFIGSSFKLSDGSIAYMVDIWAQNGYGTFLVFDAKTGEVLYDCSNSMNLEYEDVCREIAQNYLDNENFSFSDYLSLGNVNEDYGPYVDNYMFDLVYNNGETQNIIGNITVNAVDRSVTDFNLDESLIDFKNNNSNRSTVSSDVDEELENLVTVPDGEPGSWDNPIRIPTDEHVVGYESHSFQDGKYIIYYGTKTPNPYEE